MALAERLTREDYKAKQALEEAKVKTLPLKERESLLKIVIGVAIDGYGYDPFALRSPTAKEIADILTQRGIGLDEDTVRKYLQLARELLPRDETEQRS